MHTIEERNLYLFDADSQFGKFASLVNSPVSTEPKNSIMKLIPRIRKGNIELSKDPKLALEFEWNSSGKTKVNFSDVVRRADYLFDNLSPGTESLNICFDELELSYNTKKQLERDSKLIRDLIVTIDKINAISKRKRYPICLYAAIRSEVQVAVASLGKEINKILGDFGTEILWNRAGIDDQNQPLLYVVTERLKNALVSHGKSDVTRDQIWEMFFPKTIQNLTPQKYILHNSWYRPRDIIRILKIAQDQYPNERKFGHNVFDATRKKYSEASWVEITEELKAKYLSKEIEAIKRLLYGYKQIFDLSELKSRILDIHELYPEVQSLMSNHKLQNILMDLYRIGAIGNFENGNLRFVFRGNDEILLDQKCFVHNALKAHLSISKFV